MSKEIKSLKSQLKDLAEVLNGFESEFVQLKVLKMLTKSGYLDIVTDKKSKSNKPEEENKPEQKSGKESKRKKESKKADEDSTEITNLNNGNNILEKVNTPVQVNEELISIAPVTQKRGRKKVEKVATPDVSKKAEKTVKASKTAAKTTKPAAKTTKSSSGKRATGEQPKAKGKPGRPTVADRPGPTSVLNALVETGFFDEARSIGAIIEHCNKAQGWILKSTDISGILLGLVRKNLLIRRKNEITDKYEYIKA